MKIRSMKIFSTTIIILIILIISSISYRNFLNYQNSIVEQQQEHLLTIARSISRSLRTSIREKGDSLKILKNGLLGEDVQEERYVKSLEEYHRIEKGSVDRVVLFDSNYKILAQYPKAKGRGYEEEVKFFRKELEHVYNKKNEYIGSAYRNTSGEFVINIYEPITDGNQGIVTGILVASINLENMYKRLVKPVKAGKQGYALVKDKNGTILMHPVKEQIGEDVIEYRRAEFPELYYQELQELIDRQLAGEEGTAIYRSYWWPEEKLELVKKLNSFTPAYITDSDYWVVSVVMSYSEIKEPIQKSLYSNILAAIIIISISSLIVFLTVRMIKNKQTYELETNYLKEINRSTEELRKKEAELHHKRRLETIGTLTRGIAHEFNNVLTPIMGYSEMILRNLDPSIRSYNYARTIYESSQRARDILEQIRLFSGDKNIKIKYKVVSANKTINEAVKFAKSFLPSNVKIIKSLKNDDCNIYANETQLHQMVLNLCTNAYNAMKEKKNGILKISSDKVNYQNDDELRNSIIEKNDYYKAYRDYIKISFEDNGCGMDENTIEKIFDPFFTEKLSEKSSGLGLAIVQGIIVKHGGIINVNSKKGMGSRFDVYIPLITSESITEDKYLDSEYIKDSGYIKGNEKVLIVDDDEVIVEMLKSGLMELGYKVSVMTDTSEILKRFNYIKDNFQIVITDLDMPGINGIQFAKKIKRNKPDIKVILITAYSDEPLEEYMDNEILDDYIIKPATILKLSKSIRRLIDGERFFK